MQGRPARLCEQRRDQRSQFAIQGLRLTPGLTNGGIFRFWLRWEQGRLRAEESRPCLVGKRAAYNALSASDGLREHPVHGRACRKSQF